MVRRRNTHSRQRGNRHGGKGPAIKPLIVFGLVTIAVVLLIWFCGNGTQAKAKGETRPNLKSGEIERLCIVEVPDGLKNEVVTYTGYISGFNSERHIPNYVSYELTGDETLGDEPRSDKFLCDEKVAGCPTTTDYTGSGYDRGHMAPAGDMKWDKQAMTESFYMTNICPQNHALNSGGWKRLEEKVRVWAQRDSAIIVISGPIVGGNPSKLESGVVVPDGFFKVLLAPYSTPRRAIGFIYKNQGGQKKVELQAVSVDDVEAATGYDFFSTLPDDEEASLEKDFNYQEWNN